MAAQNNVARPRKPEESRDANSTRPPPQQAKIILDFVVPCRRECRDEGE